MLNLLFAVFQERKLRELRKLTQANKLNMFALNSRNLRNLRSQKIIRVQNYDRIPLAIPNSSPLNSAKPRKRPIHE